jgi:hypothetical protein
MRSPGRTRITSPICRLAASASCSPARAVEAGGLLGGKIEQAAHCLGSAVGGHRLQGAGGGEDDDQQAAVQDLPDRCRADRRQDHQQVHVQRLAAQRPQARQPGLPPAGRVAGQEERPRYSSRGMREAGGQARREAGASQVSQVSQVSQPKPSPRSAHRPLARASDADPRRA